MLQSKAGYIDARPHIPQLEEVLLQRTAGPYIRVNRVASMRPRGPRHVRSASDSRQIAVSLGKSA
jgi:hypothetical protein